MSPTTTTSTLPSTTPDYTSEQAKAILGVDAFPFCKNHFSPVYNYRDMISKCKKLFKRYGVTQFSGRRFDVIPESLKKRIRSDHRHKSLKKLTWRDHNHDLFKERTHSDHKHDSLRNGIRSEHEHRHRHHRRRPAYDHKEDDQYFDDLEG